MRQIYQVGIILRKLKYSCSLQILKRVINWYGVVCVLLFKQTDSHKKKRGERRNVWTFKICEYQA